MKFFFLFNFVILYCLYRQMKYLINYGFIINIQSRQPQNHIKIYSVKLHTSIGSVRIQNSFVTIHNHLQYSIDGSL